MLGALAGDIIGAPYERQGVRTTAFPLFAAGSRPTDDSVLTLATADALLRGEGYAAAYRRWGRRYPNAGYGGMFFRWLAEDDAGPYGSFGNGSAMRVSPVGWFFDDLDTVLAEATASAAVTHDHPEGVKGAQATAVAIFRARTGVDPAAITAELEARFAYDLSQPWEAVHAAHRWDVTCQGSVPPALQAALGATDFEDALRRAISLGGDADTQACIAGALAEALWGVPETIERGVRGRLTEDMETVLDAFRAARA